MDSGQKRLQELGYKQELKRSLSVVSNFALSFAIISILTGVTTTYNTGLTYGGPVSIVYGWIIVSFFTMCIALSMAEICSAYPTSGGLYFWSYSLAGPKWGPFASWITGWFNIFGQWATTTSANFSMAILVQVIILLATGGRDGGYYASKYVVIGFHGIFLLMHGLINNLEIKWVSRLGTLAVIWNCVGVFLITILVLAVAPEKRSAKFVFSYFYKDNGSGIGSSPYVFVVGLLMSQYSLIGYDASAHMSEETKSADKNGAYGIVSAVGISVVIGAIYLLGITFIITDVDHVLSLDNDARGYAVAQAFYDAFKMRYGSGGGGIVCLAIVAVAVFLCCMSCVTSNSRMAYAFSRDGAVPLSRLWHKVNKRDIPSNAVWLAVVVSFCMALPYLGSSVAFQAMVSIATIGSCISYALPILFRVTIARNSFVPGPFHLGKFLGLVTGWISVVWVALITVLFCLPIVYPVTSKSFNYTPVAVGGVFTFTMTYWLLSARYWFQGPVSNLGSSPLY
ncbi:hypothetical protein SELMODRAFT_85307 [Selaginella moellendorffii]|uniref:Amino acid permease/ SLC12A domain-containing protein n=1 Tax=Selaginella moellendorffii TaxID=88036 RepID=D8R6J8_SELML|nr:amino-acid permease BAT1 homolog isoform X1 [Selaginella moellendorffii]EFJ32323.1 hypothetical protein SELMODRAFT_85307 [Selaginella moellendorffii]|eukprot:XP_002966296.1 amino-acid permease BAT1 homolog isoform X1 [Selaginella moellendorffii]